MPLLEADGLVAGYGAVPVIHDISISVGEAEIVAVLGPSVAAAPIRFSPLILPGVLHASVTGI